MTKKSYFDPVEPRYSIYLSDIVDVEKWIEIGDTRDPVDTCEEAVKIRFQEDISRVMVDGWEPHGNIVVLTKADGTISRFIQPCVKLAGNK